MDTLETFRPTHIVTFYGIRCEWDDYTQSLRACRVWLDWIVLAIAGLHVAFALLMGRDVAFPLRVIRELRETAAKAGEGR